MKKSTLLLFAILFLSTPCAWSWGRLGHSVIVYIAECNISEKTSQSIDHYLKGESMLSYSSWLDDCKDEPTYRMTSPWHTVLVDENLEYLPKVDGDIISALESAIASLEQYESLNDSTVAINIKYIIHLIGDLHCPVHIDYIDAKADYSVKLNDQSVSYHLIWDVEVMNRPYNWDYTTWQKQIDTYTEIQKNEICKGSLREWLHEIALVSRSIYDLAKPNQSIDSRFFREAHPIIKQQIRNAGYRLAQILNDLFDK